MRCKWLSLTLKHKFQRRFPCTVMYSIPTNFVLDIYFMNSVLLSQCLKKKNILDFPKSNCISFFSFFFMFISKEGNILRK